MSERFGRVPYSTIRRDFNAHRAAMRSGDLIRAQETWSKCERWLEAVPNAPEPLLDAKEVGK